MARMVYGNWSADRLARCPVVHLDADGSRNGFGVAVCGVRVRPSSDASTTDRADLVTCKRCKAMLNR